MATEVKGLKVGDGVVAATFDITKLPPGGAFRGHAVDFKVTKIVSETSVELTKKKDESAKIIFDFREDSPNAFYTHPDKPNHYTGIFTNMQMMFDQYKTIYDGAMKIKKPVEEEPTDV